VKYYLIALSKKQLLTYSSNSELNIGDLVLASIRNKEDYGIVIKETTKPEFQTKEITKVLFQNFVGENQIKLAEKISKFYICKKEVCYNLFIPPKINTKGSLKLLENHEKIENNANIELQHNLTENQNEVYEKIKNSKNKFHLLHGVTGSGKTEIYCNIIKDFIIKGQQVLLLVPEINLTPQLFKYLNTTFQDQIVVYNSKLNKTERLKAHLNALSGNKKIFLGSRSASFLPFNNLGLVIMDEEHDQAYKQDTNPRYHSRAIAQYLSELFGAKVVYGSATPSIEIYKAAKVQEKVEYHVLNQKVKNTKEAEITLVCLKSHFRDRCEHLFTQTLVNKINYNLEKNKQTLLLYTKKGFARNLHCSDCGENLKCNNCDLSLVEHKLKNSSYLKCHMCGLHYRQLPSCKNCKSNEFKSHTQGIEQVYENLNELFPQAKTLQLDADKLSGKNSHKEVYEAILNKEYDIILGTQLIAQGLNFPDVNLIGILNADQSLNFPDFRSFEKSISLFKQIIGRTNRHNEDGEVVIQTWQIDNKIFNYLKKENTNEFYDVELNWRKKFNYPPYVRQTRLLYSHTKKDKLNQKVKNTELKLNQLGIKYNSSSNLIEKMHNKYHHNIILEGNQPEKIIQKINLDDNWKIDRDPQNFY